MPDFAKALHDLGAAGGERDDEPVIRICRDLDAARREQIAQRGGGFHRLAAQLPAAVVAEIAVLFPGQASPQRSAQAAHDQADGGFRRTKSSAICSNVTHSTPACEEMCSMILSSISRTCGRPETSGWIAIVNAA